MAQRQPSPVAEVITYEAGALHVLDQTMLPDDERWAALSTVADVVEAISSLRVRGAPLIGIAGAYGLAVAAHGSEDPAGAVEDAAGPLRSSRPTAVNLAWAVDRTLRAARSAAADGDDVAAAVEAAAKGVHEAERSSSLAIGHHGARLVPAGARVLTYCNTGALATGGIGTALGVIRTAHGTGSVEHVWVPETRPLLQGARLTAWELGRQRIPHAVVTEGATGSLFSSGEVDLVIVGADRIAASGDVANKVGTYVLAVLAARHGVPFVVAAPRSTIDAGTSTGAEIEIEQREPAEVLGFRGTPSAPATSAARNPAFDVTPAELVTAIVTEDGVHRPPYGFVGTGTTATVSPSRST